MNRHHVAIPMFLLPALSVGMPTMAAEAVPPADQSEPVTTARVGGSPADQAFRTATQEGADRYRASRAACRAQPSVERSACVSAARSELKRARLEAKAATTRRKTRRADRGRRAARAHHLPGKVG